MIIINNSVLPFGKSYIAINLFGIIFAKEELSDTFIRHEQIHTAQQKEMLFLGFYVWYVIEWLVRLLIHHNMKQAYLHISFEKEAYQNQDNMEYLMRRDLFSWIKYL